MRALLYKEFRLAMHPVCYAFVALFPFMILIPSFPAAVGSIYIMSCYPVLFLGANKGQQSNDLLFSTLLPVRKKDIVLARIVTVAAMQFAYLALMSALLPLALLIQDSVQVKGSSLTTPGLPLSGFVSILAIGIIGFAIADLIFFPIYYKRGRSIVASTLMTILGFAVYLMIFTVVIPYIPGCQGYVDFLCNSGLGWQFMMLGIALAVYVVVHFLVYRISAKRLEKVDF